MVEFGVLGPVELRVSAHSVNLGPGKQRGVLAALLVDKGHLVRDQTLIDRIWGDFPPAEVRNVLYTHVSRIRRLLIGAGVDTSMVQLSRRSGGYLLQVERERIDLDRFRLLVADARTTRDPAQGVAAYRRALSLWRGEACADLSGAWFDGLRMTLDGERLAALADCLDAELLLGRHTELMPELRALRAAYPLDERLAGQAMLAAYRGGRQAEAFDCYGEIRRSLADELGVDPAADLQQLHDRMLHADPTLAAPPQVAPEPVISQVKAGPLPAQLPHDVAGFTGRTAYLKRLNELLDGRTTAVVISAIAGTAGVGKTALAVHWAHRVADRFPDGQLYVNLRGFDPTASPMTPDEAVRGFLDAFEVPAQRIPMHLHAQTALYRSLLAGRRMLVVLDNARDAEHVRPLLPGSPGCLVVVTSRNKLGGLIAGEGADALELDLLSTAEAGQLLARRLGPERVGAEPQAVEDIITWCAGLPLALAIVAARAATHPQFPLAMLAEELFQARGSLDAFTGEDPATDMRAVLSCSYRALSSGAARLFRLLGLHPGPDIAAPAAASLVGIPTAKARPLLAELTRAHLIDQHTSVRYNFHDLLRAHASDLCHTVDSAEQRHAAIHRLLDHYLHTAYNGDRLLHPYRDPLTLTPPQPGVTPEHHTDRRQALAWFVAEHPVLLAVIDCATTIGLDTHVWQLAWSTATFLDRQGHWRDMTAIAEAAVAAAQRLAEPTAQAITHRVLAHAYAQLSRLDDANAELRHALDQFHRAGDLSGQAHTHSGLAVVGQRQGRYHEALNHARQALDLFRAVHHRRGQANALNAVGWNHAHVGDYKQALIACQQALILLQELDDRAGQADTWDSLGYAHHHLGHPDQAITCYQRALDLYREIGHRYMEADTLTHVGDTYQTVGQARAARDAWQQALTLFDELDHPDGERVRSKLARSTYPLTPPEDR